MKVASQLGRYGVKLEDHEGPLYYERKNELHRKIRKHINFCVAMDERKQIRKREELFIRKDNRHFREPHKMKSRCSKLRVNSEVRLTSKLSSL